VFKRTSALREVTYSYVEMWNDLYFNKTIFCDYTNIDERYSKHKNWLKFYARSKKFLKTVRWEAERILHEDIAIMQEFLRECDENERSQVEQLIAALEFRNQR